MTIHAADVSKSVTDSSRGVIPASVQIQPAPLLQ
jgi:hypothetical protein